MTKFLQSRSANFWGKCALTMWLVIILFCISSYFCTLSANVKSPVLLLLLYVYAECIHMKARILGFNGGYARGKQDGKIEGYELAEKHYCTTKPSPVDEVNRG